MDAPSIISNHGKIGRSLLFAESRECFTSFFGAKPAAGSAMMDAAPRWGLLVHGCGCDKPSQSK
jgi:hypothetical protein